MACKNFCSQRQTKCTDVCVYRKLRPNQSKAEEEIQENMTIRASMSGKENEKEEPEAWKGNQTLMNSATLKGKAQEKAISMWDCGSPLYDSYELVSLDHIIDRHLMAFPSLHGSTKPMITRFTHHSHDMVSLMAHKVGSPEKSKESSKVTSLSKFLVKMKGNDERKKKNKSGLAGLVVDYFVCGGNKKIT